jgi:hypothetical protein
MDIVDVLARMDERLARQDAILAMMDTRLARQDETLRYLGDLLASCHHEAAAAHQASAAAMLRFVDVLLRLQSRDASESVSTSSPGTR